MKSFDRAKQRVERTDAKQAKTFLEIVTGNQATFESEEEFCHMNWLILSSSYQPTNPSDITLSLVPLQNTFIHLWNEMLLGIYFVRFQVLDKVPFLLRFFVSSFA